MPDPAKVYTPHKTVVYIDGFNLYYGAIKGTPYKWLNLQKYFKLLLSGHDLVAIRYFTAMLDGGKRVRQQTYLDALGTTPIVNVELGRFKPKTIRCGCDRCPDRSEHFFSGSEEKRTDVAIAARMIEDTATGVCQKVVLVSGDSDLVPAIQCVRRISPNSKVLVYVPAGPYVGNADQRKGAREIRDAAHDGRILPNEFLPKCQFQNPIEMSDGSKIVKPANW